MSKPEHITIKDRFPIAPQEVSTRLFFAKESELSSVWHICDTALGFIEAGNEVVYTALHGKTIKVKVRADTVLQAQLRERTNDTVCERCMNEFNLAIEYIKKKNLLKFE